MKRNNKDDNPAVVIKTGSTASGMSMGILAVLVAIGLAIGGWLWFNDKKDTPASIVDDVTSVIEGASAPETTVPETTPGTTVPETTVPGTTPSTTPDVTVPASPASPVSN